MRKQLERDITAHFGLVFGSKKLAEQRREIITNALDRYDEEIQNGASPTEAYKTAFRSISDLRELKKAFRKANRINLRCLIAGLLVGIPCLLILILSLYAISWTPLYALILMPVISGIMLLVIAVTRLTGGYYVSKTPHIVCAVIGGVILLICLLQLSFPLLAVTSSCRSKMHPRHYDYSEQASMVESVSYVKINALKPDGIDYTVQKVLDPTQNEAVVKDLSSLKYYNVGFGHPFFVHEGQEGILVQFRDDSPDTVCCFYSKNGVLIIQKGESGNEVMNYGPYCEDADWNGLISRYFSEPRK